MAEDLQLNEQQQQQLVLNHTIIPPSSASASSSSSPSTTSSALFSSEPSIVAEGCSTRTTTAGVLRPAVNPPAVNRCVACRKRVGQTGFKCRCGVTFCGTHRYPERHTCSFDYKAMGKDQIAMANPVVKADKLHRI